MSEPDASPDDPNDDAPTEAWLVVWAGSAVVLSVPLLAGLIWWRNMLLPDRRLTPIRAIALTM